MNISVPCPLCLHPTAQLWAKARDIEYGTATGLNDYYQCPSCEVLFIHPMPVNALHIIYPSHYYSFQKVHRSLVMAIKTWLDCRFYKNILRQLPSESLNILDIGGGQGNSLEKISALDNRIRLKQLVDLDSDACDTASARGQQVFQGRFEDFETTDKFHLIMALNIIEHVEQPDKFLEKIVTLLAPGGLVVLQTPNYDSLDARLFRHRNWGGLHCPRHWLLFTRKSLQALSERQGLTVDQAIYTQGAPFWAVSILGWLTKPTSLPGHQQTALYQHPAYGWLCALFAAFDFLRRPFSKTSQMIFVMRLERSSACVRL